MGKADSSVTTRLDPESGVGSSAASHADSLPTPQPELLPAPDDVIPPIPEHFEQPLWLQKITSKIPSPIRKVSNAVAGWVKGPVPPRIYKIRPFFPQIQTAPLKIVDRLAPKRAHKLALLLAFYFVWLLCFVTILNQSAFTSEIAGYGSPTRISCTDQFWGDKNSCGVNGNDCRPFSNTTMAFRCPAHCLATQQLNPHAVGAQNVIYEPLVVGGPADITHSVESAFYRGDSFICASAIHAGYFGDTQGGCGVVELVGSRSNFPAVSQNSISSTGFDSYFPLAFRFRPGNTGDCKDLRWPLLGLSVALTALLSIFTDSPPVFFWSIFCILFFHNALVSDPPTASDYYSLVSSAIGRFLPAAFCMGIMYQYCVRRQLTGLKAQFEKTILWLGACWVGTLNNYTFDKIPINRLTPHDIQQQPGAVTALVIIVLVIFCIAVGQIWAIRVEGRLPRYLALYGFIGFCLLMFLAIPNLNIRLHHYILGLLLLPGTAVQNRPSLLYQGLLVGLFIDGTARWGFDSILQTPGQLLQDGQLGSGLPVVLAPAINSNNITLNWSQDFPDGVDGLSVLVNDVERYRGYVYDGTTNFTWTKKAPAGDPEYFRFGYMQGTSSLDYTKAAIWDAQGHWIPMEPGASKIKVRQVEE